MFPFPKVDGVRSYRRLIIQVSIPETKFIGISLPRIIMADTIYNTYMFLHVSVYIAHHSSSFLTLTRITDFKGKSLPKEN
jgi:hypothetical protein